MDPRCNRVLKAYENSNDEDAVYVDESARFALAADWGDRVNVLGKRKVKAVLRELDTIDTGVRICRIGERLMEKLMLAYGEEVLLEREEGAV